MPCRFCARHTSRSALGTLKQATWHVDFQSIVGTAQRKPENRSLVAGHQTPQSAGPVAWPSACWTVLGQALSCAPRDLHDVHHGCLAGARPPIDTGDDCLSLQKLLRPKHHRISGSRCKFRARSLVPCSLIICCFAASTTARKLYGSVVAKSDRTLRFRSMPAAGM